MKETRFEVFADPVSRIRASGILDRSQGLSRLFDYLADPAQQGRILREADIAHEVFGRAPSLSGDASVRVYIHRLRRKLEAFYAGPGAGDASRLSVPVGEYRLDIVATAPLAVPPAPRRPWIWMAAVAGLALLAANVAGWAFVARQTAPSRDLALVAGSQLWSGLGHDRPVIVVVGDYYIFGDTEHGDEPKRMVRAFEINSPADLDAWLMDNPQFQGRYIDLDTYYTPVGATLALREILPLVRQAAGRPDRVRVTTASHLTADMMKSNDIVYVGYLSALRLLQAPVFQRSRYMIGSTYDELIDRRSGNSYVSGAGVAADDRPNRDYGYLAAFRGASGNRFIIVAGARDIGVMQTAEIATDAKSVAALGFRPGQPLEALYDVEGVGRTNLGATKVLPSR